MKNNKTTAWIIGIIVVIVVAVILVMSQNPTNQPQPGGGEQGTIPNTITSQASSGPSVSPDLVP